MSRNKNKLIDRLGLLSDKMLDLVNDLSKQNIISLDKLQKSLPDNLGDDFFEQLDKKEVKERFSQKGSKGMKGI